MFRLFNRDFLLCFYKKQTLLIVYIKKIEQMEAMYIKIAEFLILGLLDEFLRLLSESD